MAERTRAHWKNLNSSIARMRDAVSGLLLSLSLALASPCSRADSVVVFNEIMYHPLPGETASEWIELHNQMSVAVDLSGWSITGGVSYQFPNGATISGGGFLVVSSAPATLQAATGATNIWGSFAGRLSNEGDVLELRNNNNRLMDKVEYGVEGGWPAGPDGSGVSLAKQDENTASQPAQNWTVSALLGGTPGCRNFTENAFEVISTTPVTIGSSWKFNDAGEDLGTTWRETGFDDQTWSFGPGLFKAGNAPLPLGDPQPVPTLYSSGTGDNHQLLAPGSNDPHYWLIQSAMGIPPPPPIAATVIENHPAWAANDYQSSWIGPLNPGTANVAAGVYNYRTQFSLEGFDPSTCILMMSIGADNRLNDVLLNGVSRKIGYVGFAALSDVTTISNGFVAGLNTLDFLTANDSDSPNPAGFRVILSGTARTQVVPRTVLQTGPRTYYFRTSFHLEGSPRLACLQLNCVLTGGAVFFLNGTDVLRLNMPSGPITASTPALSNISNSTTLGPFNLPNTALLTGTNVLAVELHATAGQPGDVLFGAGLSLMTTNILVPPPVAVAFNEFSSATNDNFWIELINYGDTSIDLGGCVLVRRGGATNCEFNCPPLVLAPGEFLQLAKGVLGFGADPGDRLFLYDAHRTRLIDAIVAKRAPRARWPDGAGPWGFPASLTPGASNHFLFENNVVINEIMYHAPRVMRASENPPDTVLLPLTANWRYNQTGANPGAGWFQHEFNDSQWPSGDALFYVEDAALPAPKTTPLKLGPAAFYFRSNFVFAGGTNGVSLRLGTVVDDGAVFYLNGYEAARVNMPEGTVSASTWATPSVGNATYLGPFDIPLDHLIVGTNLLAVEVHQASASSSDVVFGAELTARYSPLISTQPGAEERLESWIELYNRGSHAVDLTGWRLVRDIEYSFPLGTTILPDGYLVIANNSGLMQSNYPAISVLGPFANSLSQKSGHVQLIDAAGNTADEVRYFDDKPWPQYADGGGSSLELRDPWADNSNAEAWAASIESAQSTWSNYTYRAIAQNTLGPTRWNEFVLGLLDAGECLIDDLSVVENPSSTPVQLIQNRTFENELSAWRALGNHRHSRVESDPDNPANHVLHLIATGPVEHMHNHLETTLANNRPVVNGREYQVSFRAKWLAGNSHLNTRLYFNRAAKTTALSLPQHHGTPGARNSTFTTNLGPTCKDLSHQPIVPKPNQPVTIHVSAADTHGFSNIVLWSSINEGQWQSTPMLPSSFPADPGYTNFVASLPGNPSGAIVQFFIQGTDQQGAVSFFPKDGIHSRALYKVDDGKPIMSQLHRLRLLMIPSEAAWLHAPTNVMSNDRLGLTLVSDEREVFYDVGVHLQGSERGRNDASRVGFTLRFHADQLFRGAQDSLAADKSGGYSGLGGKHDEILLWHAVNHAGGLPGMYNDLAQIFAPRPQENGTAQLRLAGYGTEFLKSQYANGNEGQLYKLELVYYPTTTTTGDPQAPKLPQPDDVIDVDIQNWGDDPENYRWIFRQENRNDIDDHSLLIALNQAFSLTGAAFESQTSKLVDVDEWMRALAFLGLIGAGDMFSYGLNHNFLIYFRPEDQKAMAFLFDMDYQFVQSINYAFPGSGSQNTYRMTMLPNNYRRYCHHLLDLVTTTVSSAYLTPWADHYSGLLGQSWRGAVNYLVQRANYVRSRLPLNTPFAITSNGGHDFSVSQGQIALAGTAPLTVAEILINGIPYPVAWTSPTNWVITVPVAGQTNRVLAQGLNRSGNLLEGASDSITITNPEAPLISPVVINEWMAGCSDPGGFKDPVDGACQDWFELYNPNPASIDLSGYFLADALSFTNLFTIPTNTVIPAHGFLLVWADDQTNQNGSNAQGDLHVNFKLNKSGDHIGLFAPDGFLQHAVAFGAQIENVSQGLFPDGNTTSLVIMTNWTPRASNQLGSPPPPHLQSITMLDDGRVTFAFSAILGRTYQVEMKSDLNAPDWTILGTNLTATNLWTPVIDISNNLEQRFYRVILLQ